MVNYREILRLISLGYTQTQIALAVHSSRNTIRDIERLAKENDISWPLEEELTNQSTNSVTSFLIEVCTCR